MKNITTDGENVVITFSKKRGRLVKNILLEIFMICSWAAPWYTNLMWCFGRDNEPALGTFFNTVYFMAAVIVYGIFTDRLWNLLGAVCMLLSAVSAVSLIIAPSGFFGGGLKWLNYFVSPPFWGLRYVISAKRLCAAVTLVFSLAALFVMVRKYFSRAGGEKIAEN